MLSYNKTVQKHYLHPKNVGTIENPDGKGEVGNPVCLLPNEKIFLNEIYEEIKNAKEKHIVFSHDSSKNKILQKAVREYKGSILTIQNAMGKISLTPEHLIYALKLPDQDKFLRNKNKRKLTPSWYHSEDLKRGDIILYPINKETNDLTHLDLSVNKFKYDFRSPNLPNKVTLDSEILRLFGYFVAEGYIAEKPSKNYISFTLNIKEKDIIEDIKSICKGLFNIEAKVKERPERHTAIVYIYNAQLARIFKKMFGQGAQIKKLPEFIMNLPTEKQKYLIYGLWKGDGYVNLVRNAKRAGYATISYQLAQQIKSLLLRQGIISSIYEDRERISREVHHKKSYRIHVGQRDSLTRLCSILGIKYSSKSSEKIKSWIEKDFVYLPITKITKTDYSGEVHNIEVENAHSFISEAFCLHNCGDIMTVYLKIAKRKKGKKAEEYIKDIKFQTFGCGAAIATSSMITTLAKGKSLEQAEKLTRKDVSCSLQGLPPIKEHCSNLAADALKKAIEDYKKKKS